MQSESELQPSHLLGTSVDLEPVESNSVFQSFLFQW